MDYLKRLGAKARVRIRLTAPQAVVDVEGRGAIAELAQCQNEAGRVGATRHQAQNLPAGRDQVVAAHVCLDRLEQVHIPKSAY